MRTALLVSSTAAEFSGLTRRFAVRRLDWPLDYAVELTRDGQRWILVANGAGSALAREAFQVAAARTHIDAVVSTGYCGALDPALAAAEVVIADSVRRSLPQGGFEAVDAQTGTMPAAPRGPVAGADHVVATAREKNQLRQATGAATVDMESHALAQAAAEAGIPFYCIRAVTDVAREDLHLDFNGARDASGRIRTGRLLAASLRRPFSAIPELCKLAFRARRASNQLGDFLAACRFQ